MISFEYICAAVCCIIGVFAQYEDDTAVLDFSTDATLGEVIFLLFRIVARRSILLCLFSRIVFFL